MKKTIITISREFGSGGHFIGEEVAKRMNIPYYDKDIIFQIAEKTGCPVIPIAISHTADVILNHMPKVTPCHVTIEYGEPIYPKELPKEQKRALGAMTKGRIQEMLDQHE